MEMDHGERAELLEATLLRAADEGHADIADRGVDPDVRAELGYGTPENIGQVIERSVAAIAEPELSEAEEKAIDLLVDSGRHNYEDARAQVLRRQH